MQKIGMQQQIIGGCLTGTGLDVKDMTKIWSFHKFLPKLQSAYSRQMLYKTTFLLTVCTRIRYWALRTPRKIKKLGNRCLLEICLGTNRLGTSKITLQCMMNFRSRKIVIGHL